MLHINIPIIELQASKLASFPLSSLSEQQSKQQCSVDALNGSLQPALSTCGVFQISPRSSGPKVGLCELRHGWICCKLVVFLILFKKERALEWQQNQRGLADPLTPTSQGYNEKFTVVPTRHAKTKEWDSDTEHLL